jgi:cytochrome oxidase Cu insertion factor (SCO1/SenC/PrrC family)
MSWRAKRASVRLAVPGWRFASGTIASVHAPMLAFGVAVQPDPSGVPDVHSIFAYVPDAQGRLARTLLHSTTLVEEATGLLRDSASHRT